MKPTNSASQEFLISLNVYIEEGKQWFPLTPIGFCSTSNVHLKIDN